MVGAPSLVRLMPGSSAGRRDGRQERRRQVGLDPELRRQPAYHFLHLRL